MEMKIEFTHKKDTKGCNVYEEVEGPDGVKIGSLYVKKHIAKGAPKVSVTLVVGESPREEVGGKRQS